MIWAPGADGFMQKRHAVWTDVARAWADRNPLTIEEMDALYIARHQITRQELNRKLLDPWIRWTDRPMRVLEVGCSRGVQLATMQSSLHELVGDGQYVGVDIARDVVQHPVPDAAQCTLIHAPGAELPFAPGSFDLVFTSGCLMHIPPNDLKTVLSEMHRVSRWLVAAYEPWAERETFVDLSELKLPPAWLRDWAVELRHPFFRIFAAPRLQDVAGDWYQYVVSGRADHPVGEWTDGPETV